MHRTALAPNSAARFALNPAQGWQTRRWYYTPRTNRAYSLRQISPGDRRVLAEFALSLTQEASGGESDVDGLSDILFNRVLGLGQDITNPCGMGYVALESTVAGDRVIGAAAYALRSGADAHFAVGVLKPFREEQVGRSLLTTLLRQAKKVGVPRLTGQMFWSNRPMRMLGVSVGGEVQPIEHDRLRRLLVLNLK